ncbi:hypothetical protein CEXT_771041 [Caerostris extrusa]|uniref:Uncharacterized protein n=1 Tax=Caerostris extrusa TaxID=172846 RepID=A0AAV4PMK0_CAEEX|nr:hypothetical protein CEXT_771041 [Caerostris extrusa]
MVPLDRTNCTRKQRSPALFMKNPSPEIHGPNTMKQCHPFREKKKHLDSNRSNLSDSPLCRADSDRCGMAFLHSAARRLAEHGNALGPPT